MAALISLLVAIVLMVILARLRTRPAPVRVEPDQAESRTVARLLTGVIDQTEYQTAMAKLAADTERSAMIETAELAVPAGDPRARLARLGTALPEVTPAVLCMAFVLAQQGADVDTLVRMLHLTRGQASTIVAGIKD